MRPELRFECNDPALERLGKAVVAFLAEVSEADEADVLVVLSAVQRWAGPTRVTAADIATLLGTINALKLRVSHDTSGGPVAPSLDALDVTDLRPH